MDMTDLLTREQKTLALDVAQRWDAWLTDPEHNAPPNPRADATAAQREFKKRRADLEYTSAFPALEFKVTPNARADADTEEADVLGNTMLQRAQAALVSIARERERDPEPSWADAIARGYWAYREQARQIKARRWQAYLP
ncbi:MAG TPA: hypothetical protein VF808_14420 [Ktedonobacterales bacterium]